MKTQEEFKESVKECEVSADHSEELSDEKLENVAGGKVDYPDERDTN